MSAQYKRSNNVNLNQQDHRGMTTLHRAAACGNLRLMHMLREAGAWLSIRDTRGWSALHMAAYYNRPEAIDFIVNQGHSVDEPNKDGWTALHLASMMGHQDLVKSLTKQFNANPMARSVWGQVRRFFFYHGHFNCFKTPLHVAVEAEQEDIARILIEEGAIPDVTDNFGKLPENEATQDILFILKKTKCSRKYLRSDVTLLLWLTVVVSCNDRRILHREWFGSNRANYQSRGNIHRSSARSTRLQTICWR